MFKTRKTLEELVKRIDNLERSLESRISAVESKQDALNDNLSNEMRETARLRREIEKMRDTVPVETRNKIEPIISQLFTGQARSLLDRLDNVMARLELKAPTDREIVEVKVLHDLLKNGYVGGKHTSVEHAIDCLATDQRELRKQCIENLIREAVLKDKKTGYGRQISIYPEKTFNVKTKLRRFGIEDV